MSGTIEFADGDYQFPVNPVVDKLEDVLQNQAAEYDDEIRSSALPTIRIQRDVNTAGVMRSIGDQAQVKFNRVARNRNVCTGRRR